MTLALYNHQSLQAEHSIKSLSRILTKHLSRQGQMWHKYLPLATFAHSMFNSPNLANHSPYELVFGRKLKLLLDLETDPDVKVWGTYREYFLQLRKRLGCECRFLILFGINCRVELCSKFSRNRIIFSLSTSFCQLI